jgi:hypothetical protein
MPNAPNAPTDPTDRPTDAETDEDGVRTYVR